VWGAGGDLLSKDLKTATFNDKTSLEGIKFYASLYTDGLTPTDSLELNSAQIDGLFQQGRVAMVISGPWLVSTSRRNLDNGGWIDPNAKTSIWPDALAVAEIPAGPAGRFTFVGGGDLGVFKHTKHLKESIKLAQFLASDASQLRYTQATGFLPVTKTALANKVYNEDEDFKVFVSAISSGRSYPTIASWGPLETVFVANLGALWDDVAGVNGKFDPDKQIPDRLEKLATEVNSTIKNQSSP
jgi:multiple sugar transport system substrate-binding protein